MTIDQNQIQPLNGFRQKSESDAAVIACNDYLRMGANRSLYVLADEYASSDQIQPPTTSIGTLKNWSNKYGWQQRAATYDAEIERQKDLEAQEAMKKYLALDYWRVNQLVELADFLRNQIYEQGENLRGETVYHNVWLSDVKQIGSGAEAERVDLEKFNPAIISEFRGVLDDIAKETGGRIKKNEFTGANGSPLIPAPSVYLPEVTPLSDDDADNMEAS